MKRQHPLFLLQPIILSALPFLIISAALWGAGTNFLFSMPLEINSHVWIRIPELLKLDNEFLKLSLTLFGLVLAHTYAPSNLRKPVLILGTILFLLQRIAPAGALVASVAFFIFYLICKAQHKVARLAMLIIMMAALALVFFYVRDPNNGTWRLYAQLFVGLIGIEHWLRQKDDAVKKLKPDDAFLYLYGFHGVFLTIIYGYKALTESYMRRPLQITSSESPRLILSGFLKIFAIVYLQSLLFPAWNIADSSLTSIGLVNPEFGALKLGFFAVVMLYAFLIEQTGFVQVFQGISRLFGYDVKEHAIAPWLSVSFLDYWRRTGVNTRDYMLTHILMPIYLRTKNLYLSVLGVWAFWAFSSFLVRGGLAGDAGFTRLPVTMLAWLLVIKFVFIYAHACYFEMRWFSRASAPGDLLQRQPIEGMLTAALSFLIFFLTLTLGNEVLPALLSGTDIIAAFLRARGLL